MVAFVQQIFPKVHNCQIDDNFDNTTRCSCGWKFGPHTSRLTLRAESYRHIVDVLEAAAVREAA